MNCPYCGHEMIPGTARVAGTALAFLFLGLSQQHLWFESASDKVISLESGCETSAHRCPECGAVSLDPPPWLLKDVCIRRAQR